MDLSISWREILIVVVSVSLFYLLQVLFRLFRRRSVSSVDSVLSRPDPDVLGEIHQILNGLQQRLDRVEAQLAEAPATDAKADVVAYPDQPVYATATVLARDGMSAEELAGRCGISFSEAELIVALHRQKAPGQQAVQHTAASSATSSAKPPASGVFK